MCDYLVYLRTKMQSFLQLACVCPKLTKIKSRKHNIYGILLVLQSNYAYKSGNAFSIHFAATYLSWRLKICKIIKKWSLVSLLQSFVEKRPKLVYLRCNFISKWKIVNQSSFEIFKNAIIISVLMIWWNYRTIYTR